MSRDRSNPNNQVQVSVAFILAGVLVMAIYQLGAFKQVEAYGLQSRQLLAAPFANLAAPANNFLQVLSNLQEIKIDNTLLKQKNSKLEGEIDQLQELEQENKFLRTQLNLGSKIVAPAQVGKVVRYEHSPVPGIVYLQLDDVTIVSEGDWIISDGFIVGRIERVFGEFAKAKLISSPGFTASVTVGDQRLLAKLTAASNGMALTGLTSRRKLSEGDQVLLLDAPLQLAGFKFGSVASISQSDQEAELNVTLFTPVSLSELDFVIILSEVDV